MKVIGGEIRLGDPETADIVIFDETNSHIVRKALNKDYSVAVFKARPEEIRIGLKIALCFLRFLGQLHLSDARTRARGFIRGILKQLRCIYIESCLAAMNPKAVVTFIDNDPTFHWLSRNCRLFPLLAIQNGGRLRYASTDSPEYYLQHYFCFGVHEKKVFPEFGYRVENYYPVGSLLASLSFERARRVETNKYDLLIVSTWRGNIGFAQDVKDSMRSMEIMDRLLARYIGSRSIRAAVILRAERNGEHWNVPGIGTEFDYYKSIYQDCVEIIDTDFAVRNVFPLMQQSHLIVSCLSTALIEAYGTGKKVLYCNFTGTDMYHKDFPPCIVTTDCEWEPFLRKLDELLQQPQAEYQRLHREYARYLMSFPDGSSTEDVIARKIDEVIATF